MGVVTVSVCVYTVSCVMVVMLTVLLYSTEGLWRTHARCSWLSVLDPGKYTRRTLRNLCWRSLESSIEWVESSCLLWAHHCVHSCRLKVRSFLRTTVHLCTSERYNVIWWSLPNLKIQLYTLCLCVLSVPLFQVEARIVEEAERAEHYLDPSTESRITKVCDAIQCSTSSIDCVYALYLLWLHRL